MQLTEPHILTDPPIQLTDPPKQLTEPPIQLTESHTLTNILELVLMFTQRPLLS